MQVENMSKGQLTVEYVAVRLGVVLDAGIEHLDLLFDVVEEAVSQVGTVLSFPAPQFPKMRLISWHMLLSCSQFIGCNILICRKHPWVTSIFQIYKVKHNSKIEA